LNLLFLMKENLECSPYKDFTLSILVPKVLPKIADTLQSKTKHSRCYSFFFLAPLPAAKFTFCVSLFI
jgi:hypothetical protein